MNPESLHVLAERAAVVEGRPDRRLNEVHARIAHARRRRQVGVVGAAVIAVVLALTAGRGLMALTDTDDTPPAKPAPRPTPTPHGPDQASRRQVVWAVGSTVHIGDRTVDVGRKVAGLAATDDGVVFTRDDEAMPPGCGMNSGGCAVLYFTDGSDIFQIGRAFGTYIRGYRVEASSAGSTVVWFEPAPDERGHDASYEERGEYVVYDTAERREVARFGSAASLVKGLYDDSVYWIPDDQGQEWCQDYSKYHGACQRYVSVMRLDTSTGIQAKVPWSVYTSDRRNQPRMFVRSTNPPDYPYNPFPQGRPGAVTVEFGRVGDRLGVVDENGDAVAVQLASTGKPVRLRLPAGYHHDVELFFLQMWLDDDRLAISADNRGDVLICRLSSGQCRVAVRGPMDYSFGGHG